MIRWFTEHPTAANLLIVLIFAAGLMAAPTLKRETFPDFRAVEAEISVIYRGATAEEVEDAICRRIWDAVESVENLEELTCNAQGGIGRATATMVPGGDSARFVNDLRTEVSAVDDFPEQADPAIVRELHRTDNVTSVAIAGDLPAAHLERYAAGLQDKLSALPGVAKVTMAGFGTRQFRITVPRAVMEQHGLTVTALAATIDAQSVDRPLGSLETDEREISLRFTDERRSAAGLGALVVLSQPNGAELTLNQIATISESYAPEEERAFLDGQRAVFLQVDKALGADALEVFDSVGKLVTDERAALPDALRLEIVKDMTSIVRDRLVMLVQNGIMGLALVIAVMSLFFRPGFAIWAAMGLPVAIMGAFAAMALQGLSLNMMTLVALLMAIGIVMDDSIVISDSIAEAAARGATRSEAAIIGARAVMPGVLSSFATTIAVFGPLAFLAGDLGAVLEVVPLVLIAALAASLAEAFWVLPHHLSHGLKSADKPPSRFRVGFDAWFERVREKRVGAAVDMAIRHRYLVTGVTIAALIVTVGLMAGGYLKREAIPAIDGDVLEARILMPQGTPLTRTTEVVDRVTAALKQVDATFTPDQPEGAALVKSVQVRFNHNATAGEAGPHVATISADLLSAETRTVTLDEIVTLWREAIGEVPGALSILLTEPSIGPQGIAIEIRLSAPDLDDLAVAAERLLAETQSYAGVFNATHDLHPGKPELRLHLAEGATGLGLSARDVADQVGAAFLGRVISTVQKGDIAHEVELEQSSEDRDSRDDLRDFTVTLRDGQQVPLSTVAVVEEARGWSSITHVDGQRTVTVQADVDTRIGNADAIVSELKTGFLPGLAAATPGLQFEIGGQSANSAETVASILRGFLIGLVGIYVVLSFQFRSYVEPVIVMVSIPLAFIGVVQGHLLMGYNISMPSLIGAASLAGIVVNNAILLVQVVKQHAGEGMDLARAAGQASRERFRPILMSVSTTMMGLVPLLMETSTQAQTLKPLVISVVFGLFSSTLLVLIVLPAFYAILGDLGLAQIQKTSTETPVRGKKLM
ncbi:efflux RND transporter permease subunit [Antarcticimicrobium sediminis]|uniref:Efflux RND transporter permease subunit n=1 Tax=Antarcticimicrobium sediminis TaxID=2546227 RepID=A0A4R5ET20_9RHOB|nr:efflux RND transporter permease subunit [Antarcticimicrobium sediminis]TDE37924.1 efflux RND transporter permease subunit [Antarcticimicrobium sediminis]